jgi:hypothetical protein
MNRSLLLRLMLAASCKQDASSVATTSSAVAAASAAPQAPFTGTLTGEQIMGAKDAVHPFQSWGAAQSKLESIVGKATLVKDDKYMWGVSQGDDCWYMEVDKQADGTVGMVMTPMKVSKGGAIMNWHDCLLAAGVRKEAIDDPNAPGPPQDKPVAIADIQAGASTGRSKWNNAKLSVSGLFLNTSTQTMNGVESSSAILTGQKGDLKNTLTCQLTDPKSMPPKAKQYDPITVSGTLVVSEMITGAGEGVLGFTIKDCSVTATKK